MLLIYIGKLLIIVIISTISFYIVFNFMSENTIFELNLHYYITSCQTLLIGIECLSEPGSSYPIRLCATIQLVVELGTSCFHTVLDNVFTRGKQFRVFGPIFSNVKAEQFLKL